MSVFLTAGELGVELSTRLQTLTIAQGAETNVGATVYRGRRRVSDDMIPCTVLIEGDDEVDRDTSSTHISLMQKYVALAYLPCDPLHPNDAAHAAIRDLKRAFFRTEGAASPTMGKRVRHIKYLGRDIGPRADGASFVVAAIEVGVEFVEDLANP